MNRETKVFAFYLVLIVAISISVYVLSKDKKVPYALLGAGVGVLVCYVLWISFGKSYSDK